MKVKNSYLDKDEYPLNRLSKTVEGNFHLKSGSLVRILMHLEDGADPWIVLDPLIVANIILEKSIDDCMGIVIRVGSRANGILDTCSDETNPKKRKQASGNSNNPT